MSESSPSKHSNESTFWGADLVYSLVLLISAVAALFFVGGTETNSGQDWGTLSFFFAAGLFTISTGFPHPVFGHVSFDRVAQVASILVLGPVDAAWVNGIASFVYPWHRLLLNVPFGSVLTAALHNSGLMILVILVCGSLYQHFGGVVPLAVLDYGAALLLLLLVVGMQIVNDIGMMIIISLRHGDPRQIFSWFTTAVEYVAAAAGVLLAIAFTSESLSFFLLLLFVLVSAMLVIMQYALMRYRLEKLVDERTEALSLLAKEFERQATHDKLTGLPNRRYADDYLRQHIDSSTRENQVGALALADVDRFKRINDSYSHAVGDEVLKRLARILGEGCRKTDLVARYGGEEFLLYFPDTEPQRALEICNHLRQSIQDTDWSDIAPGLTVTVSLGLAKIGTGSRCRTIINAADTQLYQAKHQGRNRVASV